MADNNRICVDHLKVYHSPRYLKTDGNPFCVDVDPPDREDGTNPGGSVGLRYKSPEDAGNAVAEWLACTAGLPTKRLAPVTPTTRKELEATLADRLSVFRNTELSPDDEVVVGAIADYIVSLVPHLLDGSIRFVLEDRVANGKGG
jgi:hypothetical protein